MSQKHTLIFGGRFQPFHLGHVELVRFLSNNFDSNIIIGIVNPDPEQVTPGDDKNWVRFGKDKNPLNYWERYNLIYLSLKEFNLLNNIEAIVPLPRPSINLQRTENYISPKPRKFVLCKKWNDEVEVWKEEKYIQNGEEILWVPFDSFNPVAKLASGELIRSLMTLGNLGWKTFFPKSVRNFIEDNDLVQKITKNNSPSQSKQYILDALKNEVLSNYLIEIVSTFSINFPKHDNATKTTLETGLDYFSEFGSISEQKGFSYDYFYKQLKTIFTMQENEKKEGITINVNPVITSTNTNVNSNSASNAVSLEFKESLSEMQGILNAVATIYQMNDTNDSKEALKIIENLKKEIETADKIETKTELKKSGFKHKIKSFMATLGNYFNILADKELIHDLKTVAEKAIEACS